MSSADTDAATARIRVRQQCAAAFASGAKAMRQRAVEVCASCAADLLGASDGIDADEAGRLAVEVCVAAVSVAPLPTMSINDAPRPVAPAWGPLPTAAEVTAHVARCAPARASDGAPWARRCADTSGDGVAIVYLRTEGCAILWREAFGGVWRPMLARHRASRWRPVDADGVAVERGVVMDDERRPRSIVEAIDTAGVRLTRENAELREALEGHAAQLRGARATIAELLRADEGAKAAREERWSKYLADVERLTAEHDAAFARGVEAMRDAAATYFARRSEGIEHAAAKLSRIAPTAAVCATIDEARRVADVAAEIRAIKVTP